MPDPAKNEYMQWTKAHFGSTHWLVGYASDDDGITFGASLHAHHTVGPLPERDARLFRMLFDHMERAVRLAARPPSLANSDEALIYLGRDGRVLAMSPLAETIIGLADGISLQDGRLGTAASDTTVRLDKAVRCAVDALVHGGSGGTASICRPSGRRAWLVSAVPFFAPTSMASPLSPAAIVRIREQCGVRPVQAELFGLTPREAEVATLLAEGHSLESLACILGMARNTGRIHLQALFRKTGTNRQADLVRALLA